MTELTMSSSLLLVPVLDARPAVDGLLVGDLRDFENHLGAEFSLHLLYGNAEMSVS